MSHITSMLEPGTVSPGWWLIAASIGRSLLSRPLYLPVPGGARIGGA